MRQPVAISTISTGTKVYGSNGIPGVLLGIQPDGLWGLQTESGRTFKVQANYGVFLEPMSAAEEAAALTAVTFAGADVEKKTKAPKATRPEVFTVPQHWPKFVDSTVKGISTRVELPGQRVVILGVNGAGKTSITQAIELAASGAASDHVMRDVVREHSDLARLFPKSAESLHSSIELDNGTVLKWEMTRTTNKKGEVKLTRPVPTIPPSIIPTLPVRDVLDAFTVGAEKARTFLTTRIDALLTEATVRAIFPDDETWGRFLSYRKPGMSLGATLQIAREAAVDAAKAAESALTTAEQQLRMAQSALTVQLQPGEQEQLDAAVEAAKVMVALAGQANVVAQRAALTTRIETLTEAVQVKAPAIIAERKVLLDAARKALPANLAVRRTLALQAEALMEFALANNYAVCLCCGESRTSEQIKDKLTELRTKRLAAEEQAQVAMAAVNVAEKAVRDVEELLLQRKQELMVAQYQLAALPAIADGPIVDAATATTTLEAAVQARDTGKRSTEMWALVADRQVALNRLRKEVRTSEQLRDTLIDTAHDLAAAAQRAFEAQVTAWLPTGERFGVEITDRQARMGLWKGDELHTGLSGAERARCVAAVACATVDPKANLCVVVVEDRGWDAKTLKEFLKASANFPGCIYVATPTKWAGKLPNGWTTITVKKSETETVEDDDA